MCEAEQAGERLAVQDRELGGLAAREAGLVGRPHVGLEGRGCRDGSYEQTSSGVCRG